MGRVIKTNSIGTERNRLAKSVVLAIRELMKQTKPDDLTRDLAAYIVLALAAISDTIEVSVSAWEKRGYWVKADRFRLEWQWSETYSQKMRTALFVEDWPIVAATAVQIADKLSRIKVSEKHRLGTPWEGAWQQLSTEAPTIKC